MAFEAATIFELVILLAWKCLCVPATGKNPIFSHVFFDEYTLFDVASAASLTFSPGLFEVINAATPPTTAFFKSLPDRTLGLWGVYVLVLEKFGHESLVYLGSATHSDGSLVTRFKTYDRANLKDKALPSKVKEALENGYKIVSKRVLVSAPIPSAKDVPRFRVLFFVLEATFSFLFWTMYSKDKDYQIGSCCPWPRDSFTYGGLCSHSPLNDRFKANIDMSAEELELLVAQNAENHRLRERQRHAENYRFDYKTWRKAYDEKKAEDPQKFKDDNVRKYAELKADPVRHAKAKANAKNTMAKNRQSKRFHCDDCNYTARDGTGLRRHNEGVGHKLCVERRAAGLDPFSCEPCGFHGKNSLAWASHSQSDLHKEMLEASRQPGERQVPASMNQSQFRAKAKANAKAKAKAKAEASNIYCNACNLPFKTPKRFENHNNSARHKARVGKLPVRGGNIRNKARAVSA